MLTVRNSVCETWLYIGAARRRVLEKTQFCISFTPQRVKSVCARTFFLSSLDISQSVVYRVHSNVDKFTHSVQPTKKGKHPKRKHSDAVQSKIIERINSFPRSESNYCRHRSSKTYLEGGLSIAKMHEIYLRECTEEKCEESCVKKNYYSHVFNTKFSISFHKPKSDRCDQYEIFRVSEKEGFLTPEMLNEQSKHVTEKDAMRKEREDKDKLVIVFDLQTVFNCPGTKIRSFFILENFRCII